MTEYYTALSSSAAREVRAIADGTRPASDPLSWKPVPPAAVAPATGVVLQPGLLREAWERNILYLNATFQNPIATQWVDHLPASSEGRLLGGAGHTLRWGERKDMRVIVDA